MSSTRRRRHALLVAVLVAAVVIVVALVIVRSRWPLPRADITHSRSTTYLTEPLNADGTVNYAAALDAIFSEGVTPENNAVIPFLKAMGPKAVGGESRERALEILGLEDLPEEGDYLPRRNRHIHDWVEVTNSPWSAGKYPFLVEFLEKHEEQLSLLVEASRRPRWYVPVISTKSPPQLTDRPLARHASLRGAAGVLSCRAMLRLGTGAIEGAWEDSLAIQRLARLVAQERETVSQGSAAGLEESALRIRVAIAASGKLTAAQAREMLAELRSMPRVPAARDVVDFVERLYVLDNIMSVIRIVPDAFDPDPMLRRANEIRDRLVATFDEPDLAAREAARAKLIKDFEDGARTHTEKYTGVLGVARIWLQSPRARRRMISAAVANAMIVISLPPGHVEYPEILARIYRRLTEIALALAAFRAEESMYPRELSALAPGYLPEIPKDLFADEPLHYRTQGDGYLLYSVGTNAKDDGGKSQKDIVVRVGLSPPPGRPLRPRGRRDSVPGKSAP